MKNNKQKYKSVSFNTTIRNPGRYTYFLRVFKKSVGKVLNKEEKLKIEKELIKKLIYRPSGGPSWYKEKINKEISLSDEEAEKIMNFKKRVVSWSKRFDKHYETLEFLGLIQIKNEKLFLTENGKKFLKESIEIKESISNIYSDYLNNNVMTNILLKVQTNSPLRKQSKNKVNFFPFLINLIHKINSLSEQKGISKIEFMYASTTICNNYLKTAEEIIKIRKEKGSKTINIEDFDNIYPLNLYEKNKNFWTTLESYFDANIRMYKTTGLLKIKGNSFRVDLNLSEQEKINKILVNKDLLENKSFNTKNEYIEYLNYEDFFEIEDSESIQSRQVFLEKILQKNFSILQDTNKKTQHINDFIKERKIKLEDCLKDLNTLIKNPKPSYKITELKFLQKPLVLEFLVSLILSLTYKSSYQIIPNLSFDDYNLPNHFATGNKGDILCLSKDKNFLIEVTLIKNLKQQINSETTTVSRHLFEIKKKYSKEFQCVFLAPIIHYDTFRWFRFENKKENLFLPLEISEFINLHNNLFFKYDEIFKKVWEKVDIN